MGTNFSNVFVNIYQKKDIRALMVGLDASGKTTILYKLKMDQVVSTIPTIGFNVQTIQLQRSKITVWDVGGHQKIRPLWRHYYLNTNAVIFVVDATDKQRIQTARQQLKKMLQVEQLNETILLIFANKMDIDKMNIHQIAQKLDLKNIRGRPWRILGSCAITGQGLKEGFKWIENTLNPKKPKN